MAIPTSASRKVLVIDDDPQVRTLVRTSLRSEFTVLEATNGREGLRAFYQQQPDLVVLDAVMPELDGWETLRRLRELADTPIIMLTGLATDQDAVRSLDAGADEYVTKPFSPTVLAARIRAALRRAPGSGFAEVSRVEIDAATLVIDRAAGRVWLRDAELSLSPIEFRLLSMLAANVDRVVTTTQILENVWGPSYASEVEYVKNYVRLVRAKIEDDPRAPRYLVSRRGLGYMLVSAPNDG